MRTRSSCKHDNPIRINSNHIDKIDDQSGSDSQTCDPLEYLGDVIWGR